MTPARKRVYIQATLPHFNSFITHCLNKVLILNKLFFYHKKTMKRTIFLPFLCAILGLAQALQLKGTQEGSCHAINRIPLEHVDPNWLDTLPYVTAGSKFQLYRHASVHPRFYELREFEFYYDACFVKNSSLADGNGSMFGFGGRVLGSFDLEPSHDPSALLDAYPNNPQTGPRSDFIRQRVTLTDHKTFAVLVNCWMGADQRGWTVFSLTPVLDRNTERLIEDHIAALGLFKRENFIFLSYANCKNLEAPLARRSSGYGPRHGGQSGHHWQHPGSSHTGNLKRVVPSVRSATLKTVYDGRNVGQASSRISSSSGMGHHGASSGWTAP